MKFRFVSGSTVRASLTLSVSAIGLCAAQGAGAQTAVTVTQPGQTVSVAVPTRITNQSTGTVIAQTSAQGTLIVDNRAGASIASLTTFGPSGGATRIINAGTINGDVALLNGGVYVNAGGTVTGNLTAPNANTPFVPSPGTLPGGALFQQSFKTDVYIDRAGNGLAGVQGIVDPGNGLDFYITSYAASGTHALSTSLPTHFEVGGVEALGRNTVVTVTNETPGIAANGLSIWGTGEVVNRAIINPFSFAGSGYPSQIVASIRSIAVSYAGDVDLVPNVYTVSGFLNGVPITNYVFTAQRAELGRFANEGTINGDIGQLTTAAFSNSGTINLSSNTPGTLITASPTRDFSFSNSGTVTMAANGTRPVGPIVLYNNAINLTGAVISDGLHAATVANSGSIQCGLGYRGNASTFTFTNSGTIDSVNAPVSGGAAVALDVGRLYSIVTPGFTPTNIVLPAGETDAELEQIANFLDESKTLAQNVSIGNDGTINGGIVVNTVAKAFAFTNNGDISIDASAGYSAVELSTYDYGEDDQLNGETASFVNTKNIVGGAELSLETRTATVTNSGTISRALTPGGSPLFPSAKSGLEVDQDAKLNTSLTITNSGLITSADYGAAALSISVEAGDEDSSVVGADRANASVTVVNSGTIIATGGNYIVSNPLIGAGPSGTTLNFAPAVAIGVDATGTSSISFTNEATGIIQGKGLARFGNQAGSTVIQGQTGEGVTPAIIAIADSVTIVNKGLISGSPGGSAATVPTNFYVIDGERVDVEGIVGGAIDTGNGTDSITNAAGGIINGGIATRGGDDIVRNYGTINGNVSLGAGNDMFIQSLLGTINGTVNGGDGEDILAFDITGAVFTGTIDPTLRAKFINFEIEQIIGTGTVVSNDVVTVAQGGTLTLGSGSNVDVGAGNTAITGSETVGETLDNRGSVTGNIDMRGGNNTVTNSGTVNGNVVAGDGNNSFANATGSTVNGDVSFGNGANVVGNQGTIAGNVVLGNGGNSFTNSGAVQGDVQFGSGNDTLVLTGDWAIGGGVKGGAGTDSVQASFRGTDTNPQTLDLSGFEEVEEFTVNGGTGKVEGNATFQQIEVMGGRLIGATGSNITGNVDVGSGATFGSAGTVNGNVVVGTGGNLSPGASPGIMTVNGNLSIATGTTTTFEFVPVGQSDQIVINGGNLTIASGSTLNLTGNLTPGTSLDLIVVNGGTISGTFTTVNQAATVPGALRYTANRLQLLGTFQLPDGASVQAGAGVNYVNGLLVSGQASSALLSAVPLLVVSGGTANSAAFARITPEPYASITQLGVEQGLGVARATRGIAATVREEAGLFGFAQGLGTWRSFKGDAATGVSRAKSDSLGVLGGIGYGTRTASVGAFVGYLDSRQRIGALDARTDTDGVVAGLTAHYAGENVDLNATIAYDWSKAKTSRTVPGGANVYSRYDLDSLILDASAGYNLPVGRGWSVKPGVGVTHISTRRGATTESGSNAFALVVERDRVNATFIDGSLTLRGDESGTARIHPWAQAGLRHQLGGEAVSARAGFVGTTSRFSVAGVTRDDLVVTAGAGFSAELGKGLRLDTAYRGDFGGGSGHTITMGFSLPF